MSEQSSMHAYLNWTKQRIDEMDATLASLEAKAGLVTADSKVKADQLVADLKKAPRRVSGHRQGTTRGSRGLGAGQ